MKPFRKIRGFTLLEVLIAVVVLSIGLLGAAALNVTSLRFGHNSVLRSQASLLAVEIVERMRLNAVQARSSAYNFALNVALPTTATTNCEATDVSCTPAQLAAFDRARWATRVSALLPSGDAAIATDTSVNPARVAVTLQWDDSRGQLTAVNQTFTFNLSSL